MESNDPVKPAPVAFGQPSNGDCTMIRVSEIRNANGTIPVAAATHGMARAVQAFAAQYATAVLLAVVTATVFFPGNAFLPVPWQHDDYNNLSGHPFQFFCSRPVSTNLIWRLGAATRRSPSC